MTTLQLCVRTTCVLGIRRVASNNYAIGKWKNSLVKNRLCYLYRSNKLVNLSHRFFPFRVRLAAVRISTILLRSKRLSIVPFNNWVRAQTWRQWHSNSHASTKFGELRNDRTFEPNSDILLFFIEFNLTMIRHRHQLVAIVTCPLATQFAPNRR